VVFYAGQLTDPAMLSYVLRRARASVPLYGGFDKLLRRLQKVSLRVFGAADSGPRVQAALLIRAMAMLLPAPALDNALKVASCCSVLSTVASCFLLFFSKHCNISMAASYHRRCFILQGVYRSFVANAKFVNPSSLPHISFMGVCVVELYGLDATTAYSHAFTHVKELAVLLRTALVSKSADAFRDVYCWQTINCLELWARLLEAHADKQVTMFQVIGIKQLTWRDLIACWRGVRRRLNARYVCRRQELKPLVYPVVQLLLGAVRLVPSPRYFPLRLRLVRSLNQLAAATGVYVPVSGILLERLRWSDLTKAPKGGPTGRAPSTNLQLRVGKTTLRTPAFQKETILLVCTHRSASRDCAPLTAEVGHTEGCETMRVCLSGRCRSSWHSISGSGHARWLFLSSRT